MSVDPARELVHALAQDLEPVRPIPRLRHVALGVLAVWGVAAALGIVWLGVRPELIQTSLLRGGSAVIFGALGVAGLAGLFGALALGVPGRERLAASGVALAALAFALAAAVGTVLLWSHPITDLQVTRRELICIGVALGVGLLPALAMVLFLSRAAPFRPLMAVVVAGAGAASLGAVVSHATCPNAAGLHLLVGHALTPAVGVALLLLPLAFLLARLSRPS